MMLTLFSLMFFGSAAAVMIVLLSMIERFGDDE